MVSRRGCTVAGTSAKRNRLARRQRRIEEDRARRFGRVDQPDDLVASDRLIEEAKRLREASGA